MKVIKINHCSDCPYVDFYFRQKENQEPIKVIGNISYMGRLEYETHYNCTNSKLNGNENCEIPKWCFLEESE